MSKLMSSAVQSNTKAAPQCDHSNVSESPRRQFLRFAAAGAAVGLAAKLGIEIGSPDRVFAQSSLTPDAALEQLMAGNQRFVAGNITSDAQDLQILKQKTVDKQEPFAAVLSCADSRVPVEFIFDQTIGHVFVTRVAGNIATPEIIASLEYGALVLGTKVILVMGHASCGAVKAAIKAKKYQDKSALCSLTCSRRLPGGSNLEATTKANAKIQAALLRESSTVIAPMVKEGKVKVLPLITTWEMAR